MNEEIKKISVNDFEVVMPEPSKKEKIYNSLYESILSSAKYGSLESKSFQSLLKSVIDLAYTHGYCDVKENKPMDKSL